MVNKRLKYAAAKMKCVDIFDEFRVCILDLYVKQRNEKESGQKKNYFLCMRGYRIHFFMGLWSYIRISGARV